MLGSGGLVIAAVVMRYRTRHASGWIEGATFPYDAEVLGVACILAYFNILGYLRCFQMFGTLAIIVVQARSAGASDVLEGPRGPTDPHRPHSTTFHELPGQLRTLAHGALTLLFGLPSADAGPGHCSHFGDIHLLPCRIFKCAGPMTAPQIEMLWRQQLWQRLAPSRGGSATAAHALQCFSTFLSDSCVLALTNERSCIPRHSLR